MNKLNNKNVIDIFECIKDKMLDKKDELIDLDSSIGDGDLGITMSEGFVKVCENAPKFSEETIANLLKKSGFVMANAVPSTMGTLMATAIMKSGAHLGNKEFIEASDVSDMFKDVIAGIEKRGKCKRGEKTLLDAFYDAMESAEKALLEGKDLKHMSKAAYEGSKESVEKSKHMKSVHGKAACFGEKTIGHQDPGTTVVMYVMESIYEYLSK